MMNMMKKKLNTEEKLNIIEEEIKKLLEENSKLKAKNRSQARLLRKSFIKMSEENIQLSKEEKKVIKAMDKTLSFEGISKKTGISFDKLNSILDKLLEKKLISEVKRCKSGFK